MLKVSPYQYDFISRRASYVMWKRYGINKAELRLLGMISFYLSWKDKVVAGRSAIFSMITGNAREKARMFGICEALVKKNFIGYYEYNRKPGSTSLGLHALGIRVLNEYDAVLDSMIDKKVEENEQRRQLAIDSLDHKTAA